MILIIGLVLFIILCILSIYDKYYMSGILIAIFTGFHIWQKTLVLHWGMLWWVPVYLALGVAWSFMKWFITLQQVRRDILKNPDHLTSILIKANIDYDKNAKTYSISSKEYIIYWMLYWPFSAIGTLLDDLVRELILYVYDKIKFIYVFMIQKTLGSVMDDIKTSD